LAYLGTASGMEIERRILAGDEKARETHAALAYQVAKDIGAMGTVLAGQVDAVILTGGLAHDKALISLICDRVKFLGRVMIYPGEDEMTALALAAIRALTDGGAVLTYPPCGQPETA
jgi:butyrate kinase